MDLTELTAVLGDAAGAINAVIIVIFAFFLVFHTLRGLKKGLFNQLIHTGVMLIAALISYFLASSVWKKIFSLFADGGKELLAELSDHGAPAETIEAVKGIFDTIPSETLSYVLALPFGIIVIPLLFSLCFFVINAILRIAYAILAKVFKKIEFKGLPFKIIAALLGAAEGIIIATILLLPVTSTVDLVDGTVATLTADGENEELKKTYKKSLAKVADNPVLAVMKVSGADLVLGKTSTITTEYGDTVNLREEFYTGVVMISKASGLKDCSFTALNSTGKQSIRDVVTTATSSNYYSTILASLLSGICSNLGEKGLPFDIDPVFEATVNDAFALFMNESPDNVGADLSTVLEVYFLLSDSEALTVMTSGGDVAACLTRSYNEDDKYIDAIVDTLNANARTKPLTTTIAKLSITVMSSSLGLGEDAVEVYENLKSDINDCLAIDKEDFATDEEYKAELSSSINDALVENNITLEKDIVDSMADYVAENYSDKDSISEEEFNDILFSYYDAYNEYISNNPAQQ